MRVNQTTKERFEKLLSIAENSLKEAALLLHGIPTDGRSVSSRKGKKKESPAYNKALLDYELKKKSH